MIIDSSVLVAILRHEPERDSFLRILLSSAGKAVAAPTALETAMVVAGTASDDVLDELDQLLLRASVRTIPFTADHAAVARAAFLQYGKGRHPAGLNFGDCIAYATAKLENEPLLFKGNDFRLTDVRTAV